MLGIAVERSRFVLRRYRRRRRRPRRIDNLERHFCECKLKVAFH